MRCKTRMSKDIKIQFNGEMRTIGRINDETFVKRVSKQHFCRKYSGFGINYEAFKKYLRDGDVLDIKVIYEREDGTEEVLVSSLQTWVKHGEVDQLGSFPKQIFLAKQDFDKRLN